MPGLDEKDELNVQPDSFGPSSIFYIIDKLKNISKSNPTLTELGEFYNYIPNVDLMICTDMGAEPADFIVSSSNKLVFIHVKCGDSALSPRSSAGAIAEVGGQAVKNIEMLISHNPNLYPANWNALHSSWTTSKTNGALQERIRLLNGKRFENKTSDLQQRKNALAQAWGIIVDRRKSPAVQKEIWVIVGNAFSSKHFSKQIDRGNSAQGETLQAYQLIDSWMSKCASADVALKFFVSP